MVETFTVRIPETVPSTFVIATSAPPAEPAITAERHLHPLLAPPLRAAARELLSGPLLRAAVCPAGISPWRPALIDAARAPALEDRIRAATHHIVLTAHAPPASHPVRAQALRAIARALAFARAGVVHDAHTACLIGPAARGDVEPATFRLADDWLSVAVASGLEVTTRGLTRFGLPELSVADVPADRLLTAVGLLRGVAVRLLAGYWTRLAAAAGPSSYVIDARLRVSAADLSRYWGREGSEAWCATGPATASVELRLAPVPGDAGRLSVLPSYGEGPAVMAAWLAGPVEEIRAGAGPVSRSRSGTGDPRSPRGSDSLPAGP